MNERDSVSVDILSDDSELVRLAQPWRELAESRGNAFVTPEWFMAWRRHYGAGAVPVVAAVRDRGRDLVGVLPLQLSRRAGARLLRFGGSNLGDNFHAAAREGDEALVWQAAAVNLSQRRDWGAILLERVPADADWIGSLAGRSRRALSIIHLTQDRMPATELDGLTWDDYLGGRSRKLRGRIRRDTRALERDHGLRFRLTEDPVTLEEDMEAFFRLHESRWAERGGSRSIMERSRRFHLDFARDALERGWLRLWLLELESRPVAAWYGWRLGDRYSHYLGGFDPEWAHHGLGIILLARAIRGAIEEGAGEFDFLLGAEPYKLRFATKEREVQTLALARRFSPSNPILRIDRVARNAYSSMPPRLKSALGRPLGSLRGRFPSSIDR
jgi:CelD/BcsL family acetyltransferase involved in cellulose biosynthesis